MATATKYDVVAGVDAIGEAAFLYDQAARELTRVAEAFAEEIMERIVDTPLSAGAVCDLETRARAIAEDVNDVDSTPEQILDDAQELADLARFFVRRSEEA